MMKSHLLACPGCARHVRVSESACPFCGSALPESFGASEAPRKPTTRLTRAALYAFGATSLTLAAATTTVACGSSGGDSSDSGPDQMSASDGTSGDDFTAAYGCPPDACGGPEDSGVDAGGGDGSSGTDAVVAAYGAPADASPVDVIHPKDGPLPPSDAGKSDADSGSIAAYGLPGF